MVLIEEFDIEDIEFGEPIEEKEPNYRDGYIQGIYRARNIIDSKQKEIERLNNIINELEKLLEHDKKFHLNLIKKKGLSNIEEEKNCSYTLASYDCCDLYLNKIKELKGSNKQ